VDDTRPAPDPQNGARVALLILLLATLATAWTLTHDFVGSTLIGATRVEQLDETLAAADASIPADARAACDEITREIPYPLG